MIISKLSLKSCGPFEDVSFSFSPAFNPIFGENETGKSTASQSIPDFLFGRVKKELYSLVHSPEQLEIEAEVHKNGTPYIFVQKSGTFSQKSIKRGDDKPYGTRAAFNTNFIPTGIDKDFFESAFRLNADELKRSRTLFASETGKINAILFSVMGNEAFSSLPDALKNQADEIYSPSGNARKKVVNRLLNEIAELREEIHNYSLSAEQYTSHLNRISVLKKNEESQNKKIRSLEIKKDNTFTKLQLNADNYFNYIDLKEEISRTVNSLPLTEQEIERIGEHLESLKSRKVTIADLKRRISAAEKILSETCIDVLVLSKEEAIRRLYEQKSLYLNNKENASRFQAEIKGSEISIQEKVGALNLLAKEEHIDRSKLESIAKSADIQTELYKLLKAVGEKLYYNIPLNIDEEKGKKLTEEIKELLKTILDWKEQINILDDKIKIKLAEINNIAVAVDTEKLENMRRERNAKWEELASNISLIQNRNDGWVKAFESSNNALDITIDNMMQDAEQVGKRSALHEELENLNKERNKAQKEYQSHKDAVPLVKEKWTLYCRDELNTAELLSTQFEEWNAARKEALSLLKQKENNSENLAELVQSIGNYEESVSLLNSEFSETGDTSTVIETLFGKLEIAIHDNHTAKLNKSNMEIDKSLLVSKEGEQENELVLLEGYYPDELKGRSFETIESHLEILKNHIKTEKRHSQLEEDLTTVFGTDINSSFENYETKRDIEMGFSDITAEIREEYGVLDGIVNELSKLMAEVSDALSKDEAILEKHQMIESKKQELKVAVDTYLKVKISSRIIKKLNNLLGAQAAMDLIVKADEYFRIITDGNYADLTIAEDRFIAQRKKNSTGITDGALESHTADEFITVYDSQMSEGTKDQLFLSLRLAFISIFNDKSERKLPFIADDILINFDEKRVRNALSLLMEFSKTTQVFFFTHNIRVMQIWNELKQQ